MTSSSEFGFRAVSWSIMTGVCWTPGLGVPAGWWPSGCVVAVGPPQQNVQQFTVRIGDGGGFLAKGAKVVRKRCGQLGQGRVEFCEGPCDVVRGKGGIDVPEPSLWRVGVGISEVYHASKIESRSAAAGGGGGGRRMCWAVQAASWAAQAAAAVAAAAKESSGSDMAYPES